MQPVSTNLRAPDFGPTFPLYPQVNQVVRVERRGTLTTGYVQQYVGTVPRDREACYVHEPNRGTLDAAIYTNARLVGSHLGLPLYSVSGVCCVPTTRQWYCLRPPAQSSLSSSSLSSSGSATASSSATSQSSGGAVTPGTSCVTSATIALGQTITQVGRLNGEDWYSAPADDGGDYHLDLTWQSGKGSVFVYYGTCDSLTPIGVHGMTGCYDYAGVPAGTTIYIRCLITFMLGTDYSFTLNSGVC